MQDVVIVGARCAGAATALLLARKGHRVLLVDRDTFPSDVLSTHFLWPRGASYLNRWGLWDRVRAHTPVATELEVQLEDVRLRGTIPLATIAERLQRLHGSAEGAIDEYASIRRRHLDRWLVEAAAAAGAEVRTGVDATELVLDGDRVAGVKTRSPAGVESVERARFVVGADGRRSMVARSLGLVEEDVHPRCTFAYWAYYRDLGGIGARLVRKGRLGLAVAPTNDGVHLVLAYGPVEWFASFKTNADAHYRKIVQMLAPDVAAAMSESGREGRLLGTADQAAFTRKASGDGFVLVGDAACFKDQCTASGMTHAFRDAELAAHALHQALAGETPDAIAVAGYARKHYLDNADYFQFVCMQAEMNPARPEELEIVRALADDSRELGRYLSMFGDAYPVRSFFSRRNLRALGARRAEPSAALLDAEEARVERAYVNPFIEPSPAGIERSALGRSSFDFARPLERNIMRRAERFGRWMGARRDIGTWLYTRYLKGAPGPRSPQSDEDGRVSHGVNFASQDYLSLTSHPRVREAALEALSQFGPHSAGSAMGLGNTELSRALEFELADFLGREDVLLFPTGWAAGMGSIMGLVRYDDHVLLDRYSHNCLWAGARAASGSVHRYEHLDPESLGFRLAEIRSRDTRNGILVVTEGLFSMESTTPPLSRIKEVCRAYDATLLVDVAHDLGASGPGGLGQLAAQGVLSDVDLVMGSFSKTFCSNGGFLATPSRALKQYVKQFSGPHVYSNGLSPVQVAAVRAALAVVRSPDGDERRGRLAVAVETLRRGLLRAGLTLTGIPSAIVPVMLGDEKLARLVHRRLYEKGVAVNVVEFPVVESGTARIRLQAMADHTPEDSDLAAHGVGTALAEGWKELVETLGYTPAKVIRRVG